MRLLKQAGLVLILRVIGAVAAALTLVAVSRSLSLAEVGIFALVSSTLLIGRYLGPLGYDQLTLRVLSGTRGLTSADFEAVERGALLRVVAISSCVVALMTFAVAVVPGLFRQEHLGIWITAAITYAASSFSGVLSGGLRSRNKLMTSLLGDGFISPVVTLGACLLLTLVKSLSIGSACAAVAMGACLGFLWQLLQVVRLWQWQQPSSAWQTFIPKAQAASLWVVQLLNYAQSRFLLYISSLLAGLAAAGVIEIAAKISFVPGIATWAIGMIVSPKLAGRMSNLRQVLRYLLLSSGVGFVATGGALLLFLVFGDWVLAVAFGQAFSGAYWPTVVLLTALTVNGLFGVYASLLVMNGKDGVVSFFNLASLITGVAVSVCMAAMGFGITGIALGGLVAAIIRDGGLFAYVNGEKRVLRMIRVFIRKKLRMMVAFES